MRHLLQDRDLGSSTSGARRRLPPPIRRLIRRLIRWPFRWPLRWPLTGPLGAALAVSVIALQPGCSSLTPVEKLVIAQDAEPLLAQIRAGEVGVDDRLPWGGAFGAAPSYFTPLCAAAFGGSVSAMQELLLLGASVNAECSPSVTPLDLVMRHSSQRKAGVMADLLRARGARAGSAGGDGEYVLQARM